MQMPVIEIDAPGGRSRRKQEHPQRSLKQLASVADKILHGIIVIEPFLPWERTATSSSFELHAPARKRKRRSSTEDASDTSIGSPHHHHPAHAPTSRPTVTRSPAPMGRSLEADTSEPGLSQRQELYESILQRRRTGPSRAGMPLDITAAPGTSLLEPRDFEICSMLRLYPLQFFQSRETLLRNYHLRGFYKKSAAQKMLHIDVNKTGKLYDHFVDRGWMPISAAPAHIAAIKTPPAVDWHPIEP